MRKSILTACVFLCLIGFIRAKPVNKDDKDWWKAAVFYQIYPRSFKDSDNDGIGDLKGITSKLAHLKDAGVTSAWLSPIYKSPQVDAGYDISDFRDIQPEYGTMSDFNELLNEAQKLDVKIVMDLVPNHSSDKHPWFEKSANREAGYENYYVWMDGKENNTKPPNNWISSFSGPAWHWNEKRGQWYLAQFAAQQPDLNYREPRIVEEMKDIMRFWLDKGVYGFRIDAVPHLFESNYDKDEPRSYDPNCDVNDWCYLNHIYTKGQPETYDMIYQWRAVMDEYENNGTRVMMTEAYDDIYNTMKYYGNETVNGAHFTFNFLFITDLNAKSSAEDMAFTIEKWMTYMPLNYTANWVLGNHDNHRVASRYGVERADGLNMMSSILPGVKVVYNGDEFAQEDGEVTYEEGQDPQGCNVGPDRYLLFSRDPERTPLQWDASVNAGFNEGAKPWLPVGKNYKTENLASQCEPNVDSHYHVHQKSIALRQHPTLVRGDLTVKPWNSKVLTFKRELEGSETFVFIFNIGDDTQTVDLTFLGRLPSTLMVQLASSGSVDRIGTTVNSDSVTLGASEALILATEEKM